MTTKRLYDSRVMGVSLDGKKRERENRRVNKNARWVERWKQRSMVGSWVSLLSIRTKMAKAQRSVLLDVRANGRHAHSPSSLFIWNMSSLACPKTALNFSSPTIIFLLFGSCRSFPLI